MTLEEFAQMTRRVIEGDGIDEYMPTACYPARRQLAVLEGIPDEADVERAALDWASGKAWPGEEYLVAFRLDGNHFKVVRREGDQSDQAVYEV
jgi:hypothetical protein